MKLLANLMIIGSVVSQETEFGIPQVNDDDVETRSSFGLSADDLARGKNKKRKLQEEAERKAAAEAAAAEKAAKQAEKEAAKQSVFDEGSGFDNMFQGMDMSQFASYDYLLGDNEKQPQAAPEVTAPEPVVVVEEPVAIEELIMSDLDYAQLMESSGEAPVDATTTQAPTEAPTEAPTTTSTTSTTTSTTTTTTTTTTEAPTTTTTEAPTTTTTSTTTTTTEAPTTTTTEAPTTTTTSTTSTTTTTTEAPTTTTSTTTTTTEAPTTTTTEAPTTTTTEAPTTTTTAAPTTTTEPAPTCADGYEYNGFDCVDVNECARGTYECPLENQSVCVNTLGSYKCKCVDGFVKNKAGVCRDINECKRDNKCHRRATCTNTLGSYTCQCPSGMNGSGFKCSPKNPCEEGTSGCSDNATCTTGPKTDDGSLSFTCACNEGFEGDGKSCFLPTTTSTTTSTTTTSTTTTEAPVVSFDASSDEANFDLNASVQDADRGSDFITNNNGSFGINSNLESFDAFANYDYSAKLTPYPSSANNDYFNYDDPFAGLASSSSDMAVASDGRFGTMSAGSTDQKDTAFWSFMHSMWNHYQDSRRHWKEATPSRNFLYQGPHFVSNNHRTGALLAGRWDQETAAYAQEAKAGKDLYEIDSTLTAGQQPWLRTDGLGGTPTRGFSIGTSFDATVHDSSRYDSSWELGTPTVDQRWFNGEQSTAQTGTSEANDNSRLQCFKCEVQYKLQWDATNRRFYTASSTGAVNSNIWADCTSTQTSGPCEYSSGVCFIEERRTWGYITLVRRGCKQAQACYMQKYQNFLVQAGRQCWPQDGTGNSMRVRSRPSDIKADEWIYNIVQGGKFDVAASQDFSDTAVDTDFDNTFTDNDGLTTGFYLDPTLKAAMHEQYGSLAYKNGMVETSRCTQCCNTANDCNNFQPETENDWAKSYARP